MNDFKNKAWERLDNLSRSIIRWIPLTNKQYFEEGFDAGVRSCLETLREMDNRDAVDAILGFGFRKKSE